jgi:hemerythrin-like domain-containing protein
MDPFDTLMQEHRFFERLLEALEQSVEPAESGGDIAFGDLLAFSEVLAGLDRMLHQVKEEQVLIPALRLQGLPEAGLLAAVHHEHEDQRTLVQQLAEAARAADPSRAAEVAYALADHTRCHIFTEETMVFPMARSRLSEPQLLEVGEAFRAFDQRLESEQAYRALRARAEALSDRYETDAGCIQPRVSWRGTDD